MKTTKISLLVCILGSMFFMSGCEDPKTLREEEQRRQQAEKVWAVCQQPDEGHDFLTGTVVKLYSNTPGLVGSSISVRIKDVSAEGETIKLGVPILGLHVQTPKGLYVIQCHGDKVYALASLIKEGTTQVKFPTKFHFQGHEELFNLFGLNNVSHEFWSHPFEDLVEILPEGENP